MLFRGENEWKICCDLFSFFFCFTMVEAKMMSRRVWNDMIVQPTWCEKVRNVY